MIYWAQRNNMQNAMCVGPNPINYLLSHYFNVKMAVRGLNERHPRRVLSSPNLYLGTDGDI